MTSLTNVPSCVLPLHHQRLETAQWNAQIMNWSIGAIEVLSLIVFVGFAVDYCLHLSQSQTWDFPRKSHTKWNGQNMKSQVGISKSMDQWILYIRNKFESDLLEMMVVLRSHKYHSCHITDVEEKDDEEEEVPFEYSKGTKAIMYISIMIVINPWTVIQVKML